MILRDPVHGLVSFETDEQSIVVELLEAREVQRLRHIRQLGLTSLAYPGADHTRFSHAIGTAFVMTRFISRMRALHEELPFWQRLTTERARDALAAALLHDIGHGPFSHLFEEALPDMPRHEVWTSRVLLDDSTDVHRLLARYDATLPERVAELVHGRHELTYLARAVSGTFDVDRCDYLLRDAYFTGVGYGSFDLDWLLRSFRLGVPKHAGEAPPLAIDGAKGLPAIESFILARLFMFQQVYFHKASRASEWMLARILGRVRQLSLDGTAIHGAPRAIISLASEGDASLGDYLALDDTVLWSALSSFRDAKDEVLADLSRRLMGRKLFKTYELYGDAQRPEVRYEALSRAREIAERAALDPDTYVGLDCASDLPFDDHDDAASVLFPGGALKNPGDVSYLLGRLRAERVERVRLIFAPELREDIEVALRDIA
ncbi:MAG: HD domain-containing protein [Polyangiaceae bacterium]